MRFPLVFKRGGSNQPALGSDTLPTDRGDGAATKDFIFEVSSVGPMGLPVQRLSGYFHCPTSGANATLTFYVWDENLSHWLKVGTVTATTSDTLFGVDLPSPTDKVTRGATNANQSSGSSLRLAVIAVDGGAAKSGEYDFAFCTSYGRA